MDNPSGSRQALHTEKQRHTLAKRRQAAAGSSRTKIVGGPGSSKQRTVTEIIAYLGSKLDDSLAQSAVTLADLEELKTGQAEIFRVLGAFRKQIEGLKRDMRVMWDLINRLEDSRADPNDNLPVDKRTFFPFSSTYNPLLA